MALYDTEKNEIVIKILYFGAESAGKRTNFHYLFKNLPLNSKPKLFNLKRENDEFLFLACYHPQELEISGMRAGIHLYCPVGSIKSPENLEIMFEDADGFIFVADSFKDRKDANLCSFDILREMVGKSGKNIREVPLAMQFNKIDMVGSVYGEEEMHEILNTELNAPFYGAVASEGIRVDDTLEGVVKMTFNSLSLRMQNKEDIKFVTFSSLDNLLEKFSMTVIEQEISMAEKTNSVLETADPAISPDDYDEDFSLLDNLLVESNIDRTVEEDWEQNAEELFKGKPEASAKEEGNPFSSLAEEDINSSILSIEEGGLTVRTDTNNLSQVRFMEKNKLSRIEDLGHENWLKDDSPRVINLNIDRKELADMGGVTDKTITIPIAFKLGDDRVNLNLNLDIRIYLND